VQIGALAQSTRDKRRQEPSSKPGFIDALQAHDYVEAVSDAAVSQYL
jgi:hypothetical protein